MANELPRLQELQARLQLVGKGADTAERERNCSAFTQEAARMLHGEGWRRIRKTSGVNVDGMDIDKLVHKDTFRIVDIIVSAGVPEARVGFSDVGELRDTSRFIEVKPEPPAAPDLPEPIGNEPDPAKEFLDALQDVANGADARNLQLDRIATALETIAAVLRGAAARLGVRL